MDRALQERLVGAAVLIALGVWLIPWVLDGSADDAPAGTEPVALKLPAPEEAGSRVIRRQTIELDGRGPNGRSGSALLKSAADEQDPEQTPDRLPRQADTQRTAAEASAAAADSKPPAARSESSAPDAASLGESAPPASTETAVADAQSAGSAAPADAAAAPDGTATHPQPAVDSRQADSREADATVPIEAATPVVGWMVQLGSFSDAGNARRQAQRIETYGHDARIYQFAAAGGRTMFRVRLGPLDTRERAQAAASTLAAHGFVAQLVAPE